MFLQNFHIFITSELYCDKNLLCKWRHYPTVTTLPNLTVYFYLIGLKTVLMQFSCKRAPVLYFILKTKLNFLASKLWEVRVLFAKPGNKYVTVPSISIIREKKENTWYLIFIVTYLLICVFRTWKLPVWSLKYLKSVLWNRNRNRNRNRRNCNFLTLGTGTGTGTVTC